MKPEERTHVREFMSNDIWSKDGVGLLPYIILYSKVNFVHGTESPADPSLGLIFHGTNRHEPCWASQPASIRQDTMHLKHG